MDATDTRRLTGRLKNFIRARRLERFMDERDLIQIGLVAAVASEARFDPSKGVYLWVWRAIRAEGAIKDAVRDETQLRTRPDKRAHLMSFSQLRQEQQDVITQLSSPSAEREYLYEVLPQERFLEFMRYLAEQKNPNLWIVAHSVIVEERRLLPVSEDLGLSESRVCQLLREVRDHATWWYAHR